MPDSGTNGGVCTACGQPTTLGDVCADCMMRPAADDIEMVEYTFSDTHLTPFIHKTTGEPLTNFDYQQAESMAKKSLIFGILGLVVSGFFSIAALVYSHNANKIIDSSNAKAGKILGIIAIVLWFFFTAVFAAVLVSIHLGQFLPTPS